MAHESDVIVVGGGTGGAFAAATLARAGYDVTVLERKSESEAGHIACGDAIKGESAFPPVLDRERLREEAFTNQSIERGVFRSDRRDVEVELPSSGCVVDRKRFGEVVLEEASRCGATLWFDTVVREVIQTDGVVRGVRAVRDGDAVTCRAPLTIDAAGALSILQDTAEFGHATFDTNVTYDQFCSAYREILRLDEPVDWDDALVFKPTAELGYLWYFPRSPTTINVGLGFQMTEQPVALVDALRRDLEAHPTLGNARVVDKLGAALPTRRPYDSAVAPGYLAVGDAAGHVNPTTGGGIVAAAKAGYWAGTAAIEALDAGDTATEATLWQYNHDVMTGFGKTYAALDLYNIWGEATDVDDVVAVITSLPAQKLIDVLQVSEGSLGLRRVLGTLWRARGHWNDLRTAHRLRALAHEMKAQYDAYPSSPDGFQAWRDDRDRLLERVYDLTGADAKY